MNPSELNELMLKIPQPDRYNWSMVYSKRNIYNTQDVTEAEWKEWTLANPLNAHTSKDPNTKTSEVSRGHIGIKRERPNL
jgi:hypothetical protein